MKRILITFAAVLAFAFTAMAQDVAKPAKSAEPAAAASGETKKAFRPSKSQVTQGQQFLKDKKLYSGEADGKYNADTRAAIRAYQKDNGLTVSGNFNEATLEKMGISTDAKAKPAAASTASRPAKASLNTAVSGDADTSKGTSETKAKRPAPFQATRDQIMSLQKILKDGKMFMGEANGDRSDELKEAVKKYQAANNLKATGGINAQTLEKAGIELTAKQKETVAAQAAYESSKQD